MTTLGRRPMTTGVNCPKAASISGDPFVGMGGWPRTGGRVVVVAVARGEGLV